MPLPPAPHQRASRLFRRSEGPPTSAQPSNARHRVTQPDERLNSPPSEHTHAHASAAPMEVSQRAAAQRPHAVPAEQRKWFVLDTNVLLHDPMCLFQFQEHDVFLPMVVLEELDAHKLGMAEVARHARHVSRLLDALMRNAATDLSQGIDLHSAGFSQATGALHFQSQQLDATTPLGLPNSKADNMILAVVQAMTRQHPKRQMVLVSNDINMRVKARVLGLQAQAYQSDKIHSDADVLFSGMLVLPQPPGQLAEHTCVSGHLASGQPHHQLSGPLVEQLHVNQCIAVAGSRWAAQVHRVDGHTAHLHGLKDFSDPAQGVWGVTARNPEQNFAMNLLTDPRIDLVTLAGTAGSGKTLMALAAGLAQVLDDGRYSDIIVTRATVSVGDSIGFLPGTEEEKMAPWMGALDDNLEYLTSGQPQALERVRGRIKIKSMSFMRGRTFMNKFVLIDEAQNLTSQQIKTLITRAGPGTKVVCIGNLAQIDTPHLTEGSSGLTYLIEKFKSWPHAGHITLSRGERSRLADRANSVL